jgi:long-subunit acyl-CoA synthetase (AMP-forming)
MNTLCEAFQRTAAVDPDAVALRTVGGVSTLTWREYAGQVATAAAGLASLGVGRGDTIALLMGNRIEFYPLDVAAQHLGATSFSVYSTLTAEQMAYLFENAGNTVVLCEARYVERVRATGVPIEHLVVLDGEVEGAITLEQLYARGAANTGFDFEAAWRAVGPEDVATLIYTSGTTGNPKGVETTHANLMFEATAVGQVLDVQFGDRITSFLPSAHIADRFTALYLQLVFGTQITVVADPKQIAAAVVECQPTVWGAVPRIWEKFKQAIEHVAAVEPDQARRAAMAQALAVAAEQGALILAGESIPAELAARWAAADEAVLSGLRARLGFRELRWAVSGAAPIPAATLAFFAGLGIPITEIWGMSELSCICSVAAPTEARLGTVGKLLPGMEYRIAEDGEFLVRGPLVMKGYRKEPEKTAEAIDADGWLHTGDVMSVDADGYLRIVDRKKELIINEAGKNLSPVNIENALKVANPLVGTAVAIGDSRAFITALLVLDAEAAAGYAARRGIAPDPRSLAADPELVATLRAGVAAGNATLSRVEQIKRFRVLPTFWEPGGDEMTPTMKLKRKPIAGKYAVEIDELYLSPAGPGVHEPASR